MSDVIIRVLGPDDASVLDHLAPEVFDQPISAELTREFLTDPRHHLVVAIANGDVVGMATAVHYINPDKRPQLFISEVGVSSAYRGRGIARAMLDEIVAESERAGKTAVLRPV
jgi:aminoglycoside 6'-N-acetyltransferase I